MAEELGLPVERVNVLLGDTDFCPDGGPTTASRQSYVSGNAARMAAKTVAAQLALLAAGALGCDADSLLFEHGHIVAGEDSIPLAEVLAMAASNGTSSKAQYEYWAPETQPLGTGGDMHFAFGFCAQAVLCEIDMRTGEVNARKVIAAHDVGRALNPLTLEGQIEGGIVMCIGSPCSWIKCSVSV